MLAGRFPYEVIGPMRDVLDRITTAQPVRPRAMRKDINYEIETIVLKCLQKESGRRDQSAGELGRDVHRYLAGEPIETKRDSTAYVLRKQLRKHRVPVAFAVVLLAVVTIGFLTSLTFWQQAVEQRDSAEQARFAEAEQRTRAAREAESATAIKAFLTDMLGSVDPMQLRTMSGFAPDEPVIPITAGTYSRDVTVAEMITEASESIAQPFAGKPELEAHARETVGMTLQSLRMLTEAEEQLRMALDLRRAVLGESAPDTLRLKLQLAYLMWDVAKRSRPEVETLARSAHEGMLCCYGPEDPRTLGAARVLAAVLAERSRWTESNQIFAATLAIQERVLGEDYVETIATMYDWVFALVWQNRLAAGWETNELIGKFLRPNTGLDPNDPDGYLQSLIVSNTATTVTVWGDFAELGYAGASYQVNDYHISSGSPCIDAADNTAVPADEYDMDLDGNCDEPVPYDLDGNPRFVDDPCTDDTSDGDPPIVDMGSYEYQPCGGDVDCDGDTDHSDLGILFADWGCP